jgi:hypothetical protein
LIADHPSDTWYVPNLLKKEEKDHSSASNGGICNTFNQEQLEWLFHKNRKIVEPKRDDELTQEIALSANLLAGFRNASSKPTPGTLVLSRLIAPSGDPNGC